MITLKVVLCSVIKYNLVELRGMNLVIWAIASQRWQSASNVSVRNTKRAVVILKFDIL